MTKETSNEITSDNISKPKKKSKAPSWIFENIAETSKNARKIYFIYISFLAYGALTVITTSDRSIILNEATNLPFFNVEIPFNLFFIFAPIVGIILFIYLQIYLHWLRRLIDDLRRNYAQVKKGYLYPWVINITEDPDPGFMGELQKSVVNFAIWWTLPIVLILFSIGFIKKHDPILSYIVGMLFPIAGITIVFLSWLRYNSIKLRAYFRRDRFRIDCLLISILIVVFLFILIVWSNDGRGITVNLSYQNLVTEKNKEHYNLFWLNLEGVHLEGAHLEFSILKRANLIGAHLKNARMTGADLEETNLWDAKLQNVSLRGANLKDSYLIFADLQGADLRDAHLEGARLHGAKNLNVKQLSRVKTLYKTVLDPDLLEQIKKKYPHLLKKPEPTGNQIP